MPNYNKIDSEILKNQATDISEGLNKKIKDIHAKKANKLSNSFGKQKTKITNDPSREDQKIELDYLKSFAYAKVKRLEAQTKEAEIISAKAKAKIEKISQKAADKISDKREAIARKIIGKRDTLETVAKNASEKFGTLSSKQRERLVKKESKINNLESRKLLGLQLKQDMIERKALRNIKLIDRSAQEKISASFQPTSTKNMLNKILGIKYLAKGAYAKAKSGVDGEITKMTSDTSNAALKAYHEAIKPSTARLVKAVSSAGRVASDVAHAVSKSTKNAVDRVVSVPGQLTDRLTQSLIENRAESAIKREQGVLSTLKKDFKTEDRQERKEIEKLQKANNKTSLSFLQQELNTKIAQKTQEHAANSEIRREIISDVSKNNEQLKHVRAHSLWELSNAQSPYRSSYSGARDASRNSKQGFVSRNQSNKTDYRGSGRSV